MLSRNIIVDVDLQSENIEFDSFEHENNGRSIIFKGEKCEIAIILNDMQYKVLKGILIND